MSESRDAVLQARFFHKGETHETDVWERVARTWGTDHRHVGALYEALRNGRFMLNSPALANAGRSNQMGSACFVLPINDSLTDGEASIMQTLKDAASVHKAGGGTGFSFGRLRGRGSPVASTGRPAPGAVNVLKLYSHAVALITQAGMRDGANMGILPIDHPDVEEFLLAKQTEGDIKNFNLSIAMTDEFMMKVGENLLDHHEQYIWDLIVDGAWRNGEPGLFFIDTTNEHALHPQPIEATNPCGEVPLRPYEACVLGSINVASYWMPNVRLFNWSAYERDIDVLVETLDNVVERQTYPIPKIEQEQKRYRKIGVGIMGFADLCCAMNVKYGEWDCCELAEDLMQVLQQTTYYTSERLAAERGTYAGWEPGMPERRNLNCQVIAPTGTISRLAECSFGIEPHFDVDHEGYYKSFIIGGVFTDHNKYWDSPAFTPASKVTLDQHIAVQAAFQKYCDQAVSKTMNVPHETTHDEIEAGYLDAWLAGCKGITVLREGSRDDVVIGVAKDGDCVGGICPV